MSTIFGQLRTHFADPLLVRSGRVMVLTPIARSLVAPLSDLMAQAHSLAALAPGEPPAAVERELRFCASDYSMSTFLAEAIQQFTKRMPIVRLEHLFEDQFTCLTCRKRLAKSASSSQKEFTQRRHVVVRYFENQMAFEDEEILRRSTMERERHVSV